MKRDWKVVWISMLHSGRNASGGFWLGWLLFLIVSAVIVVPYDFSLFEMVRRDSPEGSGPVTWFLAEAGKFEYLNLIGTLILGLLAYLKNDRWLRRVTMSFLLASAISGISVQMIKPLVGRPRPSQCIDEHIDSFDLHGPTFTRRFHSYPSGHSATTVAACSVVAISFPRLLIPCVIAALAMAWSRVYGFSHFPIDTLHGAVLGYLSAFLCTRWLKKRHRLPDRKTHAMRRQSIRRKPNPESQRPDLLT